MRSCEGGRRGWIIQACYQALRERGERGRGGHSNRVPYPQLMGEWKWSGRNLFICWRWWLFLGSCGGEIFRDRVGGVGFMDG